MSTPAGVSPASVAAGSGSICQVRMYFCPGRLPMQGWMIVRRSGGGLARRIGLPIAEAVADS
jgi:hypothetical protein